ncbi:SIR2 family protein [Mammaliicoccus sciuri]|uniref:SIR2 family protein n=1 Tax=Mammaliicoccus sciuri TaxID=1296 RepID=UPI002DC02AF3|nr:SIR2 family protein [Mammaliicoccus sciuri]MEB7051424.1 SIR2 family protein [Mammaliicoccus sciuri]
MTKYYFDELKTKYQEKKVIPFIGAGLSIPFQLKSWADLINELKEELLDKRYWKAIEFDIDRNEYQEAIDSIKKFGNIDDKPIQEKIAKSYSLRKKDVEDSIRNNYSDLIKNNFKVYVTTNYDRLIDDYLPNANVFRSLTEYTSDFQRLFANDDEEYIFHIHGCVSNPDSIVISSEKYDALYNDERFDNLMKGLSSNFSFLFLGFSFEDTFVKKLVQNHKSFFNGTHYLLASSESIDSTKKGTLSKEYGVSIIEYSTNDSSHEKEIKKVIEYITEEQTDVEKEEDDSFSYHAVGIEELFDNDIDYANSLFYQKLQLVNISEDLRDISKYFYIAAEKFIRKSQRFGLPKEFIDSILAEVFMTYKDKYSQLYTRDGCSSEDLLIEIHKNLEQINIDRLVNKSNKPTYSENKGFIHVLADDAEKDVWWGSERL